jgi:hypothetical protein
LDFHEKSKKIHVLLTDSNPDMPDWDHHALNADPNPDSDPAKQLDYNSIRIHNTGNINRIPVLQIRKYIFWIWIRYRLGKFYLFMFLSSAADPDPHIF